MSLTSAIVEKYDNDATLQYLFGTQKMWVGSAPTLDTDDIPVVMPYCTIEEISDVEITRGKDLSYSVSNASIQFNVWTLDKVQCEALVEALEAVYMTTLLTITGRHQMGWPLKRNRMIIDDPDSEDVWHGVLELIFQLEKSPL